ncbi:MAG TPA: glycosyltransferase family 4 protein [Stellaceae bacterium]|jgi:hypothetical protein|nr:glycosyltransferase family 4 protein [Stellaceae bacterium]
MSQKPRLLYIASRWPWPVSTGRQRMIDQELRFAAEEYEVTVAAFGTQSPGNLPGDWVGRVASLPLPGWLEILSNLVLGRCGSLQECLYRSVAAARAIAVLADLVQPDIVMFDMVRTAQYGEIAGLFPESCRRVLDMDDLLSDRYRQMQATAESGQSALGMFTQKFGRPVAWLARLLPRLLFGVEARLMHRRERVMTEKADMVLLVSGQEAETLRDRTGADHVQPVPPAVEDFPVPHRFPDESTEFKFLGSARYAPNAEAMRFLDKVGDHLAGEGQPVEFKAFGAPDDKLEFTHVHQAGYLDDLGHEFTPGKVMVAPILTGTGVKTKILEAMARAVAVITTSKGTEGLGVEHGTHLLVADDPREFADHVKDLSQNPGRTAEIAKAGFDYARAHHGEEKLKNDFLDNLAAARSIPHRYRYRTTGLRGGNSTWRTAISAGNANNGPAITAKRCHYSFRAIVPSRRNPM